MYNLKSFTTNNSYISWDDVSGVNEYNVTPHKFADQRLRVGDAVANTVGVRRYHTVESLHDLINIFTFTINIINILNYIPEISRAYTNLTTNY